MTAALALLAMVPGFAAILLAAYALNVALRLDRASSRHIRTLARRVGVELEPTRCLCGHDLQFHRAAYVKGEQAACSLRECRCPEFVPKWP